MIAAWIGIIAIVALWRWPDAAISRIVTRTLALPVATYLNRLDRRHFIFAFFILLVVVFASEWLAAMGPLDGGLVLMWDVASFTDALAATALAASAARLRPISRLAGVAIARLRPRVRSKRAPRTIQQQASRDDDDRRVVPLAGRLFDHPKSVRQMTSPGC